MNTNEPREQKRVLGPHGMTEYRVFQVSWCRVSPSALRPWLGRRCIRPSHTEHQAQVVGVRVDVRAVLCYEARLPHS